MKNILVVVVGLDFSNPVLRDVKCTRLGDGTSGA